MTESTSEQPQLSWNFDRAGDASTYSPIAGAPDAPQP